jgi:hypothetical protein
MPARPPLDIRVRYGRRHVGSMPLVDIDVYSQFWQNEGFPLNK